MNVLDTLENGKGCCAEKITPGVTFVESVVAEFIQSLKRCPVNRPTQGPEDGYADEGLEIHVVEEALWPEETFEDGFLSHVAEETQHGAKGRHDGR